jgi:hypothetical protein
MRDVMVALKPFAMVLFGVLIGFFGTRLLIHFLLRQA